MSLLAQNSTTPEQLFHELISTDLTGYDVNLCLASTPDKTKVDQYQRVNITEELGLDFRAEIVEPVLKVWTDLTNEGAAVIESYDKGASLASNEVEWVSIANVRPVEYAVEQLTQLHQIEPFKDEKKFKNGLRYYALILSAPGKPGVMVFRQYSPTREIQKSRFLAIFQTGDGYDRYREPLFTFDHSVDCVVYREHAFIFSKPRFHQMFRFFELMDQSAKVAVDMLKATGLITNFDEFEKMAQTDFMVRRKLAFLSQAEYLGQLTMPKVRQAINRLSAKDQKLIEIVMGATGETMSYSKNSRHVILKVLTDSVLESPMTGYIYEAPEKRHVKSSS